MIKRIFRLFVVVVMAMTLSTCTKSDPDTLPQPEISFRQTPNIAAEGGEDFTLEIEIKYAEGREVRVGCDGVVITSVTYVEPYVVFSVSENSTGEVRTGWIEVGCGPVSERQSFEQLSVERSELFDFASRTGWYELPATDEQTGLIYYSHDKLPSDPSKRNYSFCFAPEHHASLWVAYPLHGCYLGTGRKDSFGYDYAFAEYTSSLGLGGTELQANVARGAYYTEDNVQYDRGHQLPSADRNATEEDNKTTFYATNMTAQHKNINQKMWATLESRVRDWVCADTLYVVTGAFFDEGHGYAYDNGGKEKGGKRVSMPTHYYKALLRTKNGATGKSVADCTADELKCIAFWVEHDIKRTDTAVYTTDACSVAELEQHTGMTFFVNVPNAPKTTFDTSEWSGLTTN